ncbi:hypothetical protein DKG75_19485 [Zavarzinia compransoris]|uniref:Uncharacterized protein n=2 Tax=Zavarzinia compransoris TaxID=1264899 RepID=A0A317DWP2_9PROT|nr:hypothetical protein DKG75_19485 [Zavarzinia compransoris]
MIRGLGADPQRPGALGGVEPVSPRPQHRRAGPDWGLALITVAFLGGAAGLFYFGYMKKNQDDSLAAGETRIITARPETVIPDGGTAATPAASTGGQTAGTASGSGAARPPAGGGGYSMGEQATGGDVSTRPAARTAPEPAGREKPRPTSSAPGVLQAPPGVKPVK